MDGSAFFPIPTLLRVLRTHFHIFIMYMRYPVLSSIGGPHPGVKGSPLQSLTQLRAAADSRTFSSRYWMRMPSSREGPSCLPVWMDSRKV